MFTQPRVPNIIHKPAYKNIAHFDIEQITPSVLVSEENNEMMKTKETRMLDLNLQKKSFVQYFCSSSRENNSYRTNKPTDSLDRYCSRNKLRHSNTNRNVSSQNRYRFHSRD